MIKPMNDWVALKKVETAKMFGKIHIPETAAEKPTMGDVVAVGNGTMTPHGVRIEPTLKVGQRVLFPAFSFTKVKDGDEEYMMISENDILAVLED